ncbi:MAG: 50S ribosomal protein L10 [Halobacteriota archaeon]|nr:50S ribosomal protein L10 [Halobacteriota archaeon]
MMEEVHHTAHIPKWKIDEVAKIKDLTEGHSVVGIVGVRGITANQLQKMRANLREDAVLKVCRNNLTNLALNGMEKEFLSEYVEDQTLLLFTELDPFRLYKMLEETKTPAPAKPGDVAPKDIIIEKGPTSFKPGPIVGELQNAGIPAGIESGKVVIKATKTVASQGDVISPKLADTLSRLEIYPMEIGLNLRVAYDGEMVYASELLAVDESKYLSDIKTATQNAFNLAINIAYPTKETISTLIKSAFMDARNLAVSSEVYEPGVMGDIIAKAYMQMLSIKKEDDNVEYVYAALLMHSAGKEITEDGITSVLGAADIEVDSARAKALVSALDGVDIGAAISEAAFAPAAPAAAAVPAEGPAKEEENKEEEKKEEEEDEGSGMEGLGALFG